MHSLRELLACGGGGGGGVKKWPATQKPL